MTSETQHAPNGAPEQRPSLLPFDPVDLVALRVLPAEFARMLGVSKQTVSQWIKRGIVTLGPDGRLDPKIATRQYMQRIDPAKQRARVLKQAGASLDELRARVRTLESELAQERAYGESRESAAKFRAEDEADRRLMRLVAALKNRWNETDEARCCGRWENWIQELIAVEFYGHDLAEYRAEFAEFFTDDTCAPDA